MMVDWKKLMSMKWSDLSRGKQIIFICSLLLMLGTLIYVGTHVDTLLYRTDNINDKLGCKLKFRNGILIETHCENAMGEEYENPYPENYTLVNYYDERNAQRENLGVNISYT